MASRDANCHRVHLGLGFFLLFAISQQGGVIFSSINARGVKRPRARLAAAQPQWKSLTLYDSETCGSPQDWTIENESTKEVRHFVVFVPRNLCNVHDKLPVLLAFHGYTSQPMLEIQKWMSAASEYEFIVVAPEGSGRHHRGWNAIDCCGDAAQNDVDDIGFVFGVVESLSMLPMADASTVIATGVSNGGFFVSRLGLTQPRPPWLKGIVPTSGYQYDSELYRNAEPLPVFAHHGSQDRVVLASGCCRSEDGSSNCPYGIGKLRESCTSASDAHILWAEINKCDLNVSRSEEEGTVSCVEASGGSCRAAAKLCMWTNEGHNWISSMPGSNMVGEFVREVSGTFDKDAH